MNDDKSQKKPMRPSSRMRRIGVLLLFVLVVEILVLIGTVGVWPMTGRGWLVLLIFGPPVYLLLEYLGEKILPPALGWKISQRRFSVGRIGIALLIVIAAITALLAVAFLVDPWWRGL